MIMKTKKQKKLILTMVTALAMLGTTACGSGTSNRPDEDMVIKLLCTEDLTQNGGIASPWINISFSSGLVYRNLFYAVAGTEEVQPDLAESATVSDDGLTYEIVLKEQQLWSDGETIDLEDIVFSIESLLKTSGSNAIFVTAFNSIVGAEELVNGSADSLAGLSVDGNTLTVSLTKPTVTFLQVLAQFAIYPEHVLRDEDMSTFGNTSEFFRDPVVSGMYVVGEHIPDVSMEYVYNENYSGTPPNINSLLLSHHFTANELDYFDTNDISQILDYRAIANQTEYKVDNLFYRYFVYNISKGGEIDPVMNDIRVRKAIINAIDFETLLTDIYYNTGTMVDTETGVDFSYNPELAKELLAEADYDFDRPLVLLYYYSDDTSTKFMEEVTKYLEAVGFTIEILSQGNLYNEEFDHYDVGLKGLSAFDVSEWYNEYASTHQLQTEVFGGEVSFDELIDALAATTNEEDKQIAVQNLRVLADEALYKFPIFTMGHMAYVNKDRVELPEGIEFGNPRYRYDIDFENWILISE